jgi:hypothetical protein
LHENGILATFDGFLQIELAVKVSVLINRDFRRFMIVQLTYAYYQNGNKIWILVKGVLSFFRRLTI